jgi:hypothetical protein
MAFDYIREHYKVPAARGRRVRIYNGSLGTITGSYGPYIKILVDGKKRASNFHPTWRIEYLTGEQHGDTLFRPH